MSQTAKNILLISILALAACSFRGALGLLLAQTPTASPGVATKILMQEPLPEAPEPDLSLSILSLSPGLTIPAHTHKGVVFAYILDGEIENQLDPDPPKTYHPGDFFHERPMQTHRMLRDLSKTEPAKILIFQNRGALPPTAKRLLEEPLAKPDHQQMSVISLVAAPGASAAAAHQHPGQVFVYVLKGEVENQVDPDPSKIYRAGDVFYEPPLHAHRIFRNMSKTDAAELIVFEVSDQGRPLAMGVPK